MIALVTLYEEKRHSCTVVVLEARFCFTPTEAAVKDNSFSAWVEIKMYDARETTLKRQRKRQASRCFSGGSRHPGGGEIYCKTWAFRSNQDYHNRMINIRIICRLYCSCGLRNYWFFNQTEFYIKCFNDAGYTQSYIFLVALWSWSVGLCV